MTFSLTLSEQLKQQAVWYLFVQCGRILTREWRLLQSPLPFLVVGFLKTSLLHAPAMFRAYMPIAAQQFCDLQTKKIGRLFLCLDARVSSQLGIRSYETLFASHAPIRQSCNLELIRYCIWAETPSYLAHAAVDRGSGLGVRYLGGDVFVWTDYGRWLVVGLLIQKIAKKIRVEG